MRFTYTLIFFLGLFYTASLDAQINIDPASAIVIDNFPHTEVDVESDGAGNNGCCGGNGDPSQVQGSCVAACCDQLVYKVVTPPVSGTLRIEMDDFEPLASSILGYTASVPNPDWADLTYLPGPGNFCGFRDTMQLNGLSPSTEIYVLLFNSNTQTGVNVGNTTNLTFDFTPDCNSTLPQPEIEIEGNGVIIPIADDTPSETDDTDLGSHISGESPITRTYTIKNINPTNSLDIHNVSVSGANASDFTVITPPSSTVSGNGSTTFTVEFTPNTIGTNEAMITVGNSDCDRAAYTFDIEASVFGTSISDVRGSMLELSGSGEYVEINNVATSIAGSTEFTLEAWINADATQTGNDRILSINTSGGGNVFLFYLDDGVLSTFDGSDQDTYGTDLRGTGWHHVAVTHNNSRDSVYLDGAYMGTFPASVSAFAANNLWSIGQEYDSGPSPGDYFKGKMDEIRIWKDVRTKKEIQENMHLTFSAENIREMENLVAYYQFDNDDVATTADGVKDILGNHGTIVNGGTYNPSEVAVGAGISQTQAITSMGPTPFADTGIALDFSFSPPDGDIVITRITSEAVKNGSGGEMTNTLDEYWVINNYGTNNTFLNAHIIFEFEDGFIDDNVTANHSVHQRGSNQYETGDWTDLTPIAVSSDVGDNSIRAVITGFSQFYVSSNTSDFMPTVLPVELLHFNARRLDKETVQLDWETASETNNRGFQIERLDGNEGEFKPVGWIEGSGNATNAIRYQFKDDNSYIGTSYYRLKQMDFDGQYEYSNIVAVHLTGNDNIGELYPNPSDTGIFNLDYTSTLSKDITIALYDLSGKLIHSQVRNTADGMNQLDFDFSFLNQGVYLVHLNDGQAIASRKIIIR